MSEYTELIEQLAKKDAEIEKLEHEIQQCHDNMHNLIDQHKKHIAGLEKDRDAWKKRANCNIAFVAKESNPPEVE